MKYLFIDGNNLIIRFAHVFNEKALEYSVKHLEELKKLYPFDEYAIAFDNDKETFRHKLYPTYKQGRLLGDEIKKQVELAKECFSILGTSIIAPEGFEADDVLATLSLNKECCIVSNDSDLFQLLSKSCTILKPIPGGGYELIDEAMFRAKYSISPIQMPDLKALTGDEADNIQGIKGIGLKKATELLIEYLSIEGIFDNLDNIMLKYYEKLENQRENALLFKALCTLRKDVVLEKKWMI